MKKVLIITSCFPPEGGGGVRRVLGYARYLPEHGWQPVILTPLKKNPLFPDEAEGRRWQRSGWVYYTPWLDIRGAISAVEKFIPDLRPAPKKAFANYLTANKTGIYPWLRQWLLVPDEFITWLRPAVRRAMKIVASLRPEAVISMGPSHVSHMVGHYVAKKHGLAWIADFKDPWASNPFVSYPSSFHKRLNRHLERRVLETCSMAITVSKSICSGLQELAPGLQAEVLPNGYDPASFKGTSTQPEKELPLRIIHAGIFYGARTPFPFLEALKILKTRGVTPDEVKATFLGAATDQTRMAVEKTGLEDYVEVKGHVPHREAVEAIASHDVCLLLPGPGSGTITGKVFEYLAAGKPILCIGGKGGDLDNLLHDVINERPFDINATERAAKRILEWIHQKRAKGQVVAQVDEKRLATFDRSCLTSRLAGWLDQLTSGKS